MAKLPMGITSFPELTREMNKLLEKYDETLSKTPKLNKQGDLDLQGKRIMRVGQTKLRDDVPSRKELERKGLYETPDGNHVANSNVIVSGGIRSTRRAKEPDELVPLRQMLELVSVDSNAVSTTNLAQTVLGIKTFRGFAMSRNSVTCVTGNNNNVTISPSGLNFNGGFVYVTAPTVLTTFAITGIQNLNTSLGGYSGQVIIVYNSSIRPMTLVDENATAALSSTSLNRFRLSNSTSIVVNKFGSVMLVYDDLVERWVNVARV